VESSVVAKLVIIKGLSPETCCITSDSIYLGRLPTNDFVLAGEGISRKHARIHRRETEYYIQDLGSTNGTFVNDIRLDNERKLSHGDVIKLGRAVALEFDFPVSQEIEEEAAPDEFIDEDSADSAPGSPREETPDEEEEAGPEDLDEIVNEPQPVPEVAQEPSAPGQKLFEMVLKVNELISRIIKSSDSIKSHLEELDAVEDKSIMTAAADSASALREDAVRAANMLYSLLQELDPDAPDAEEHSLYNLEELDE